MFLWKLFLKAVPDLQCGGEPGTICFMGGSLPRA